MIDHKPAFCFCSPIDNTELLCKHANVPPNKVNSMKRISEVAWANLLSKVCS